MTALSSSSTCRLRSGIAMPLFGLGTWLAEPGSSCKNAVSASLRAGYRLIDTAALYNNEQDVGDALKESGLSRDDVFVVTKLHTAEHGSDKTLAALRTSLTKLGLQQVDLFLIHSPSGGNILETWRMFLEAKKQGLARVVGVSNFGIGQLQGLLDSGLEMPEVNQIELHPWLQQHKTVDFCKQQQIQIMGYCPLARCKQFGQTKLLTMAQERGVPEAQMAVRWALECGYVTIPKSTSEDRISQNAAVFNMAPFSMEEQQQLLQLDCGFKASNSVNSMDLPWEQVKD